jgi:uncharacterized integral membrane protein
VASKGNKRLLFLGLAGGVITVAGLIFLLRLCFRRLTACLTSVIGLLFLTLTKSLIALIAGTPAGTAMLIVIASS